MYNRPRCSKPLQCPKSLPATVPDSFYHSLRDHHLLTCTTSSRAGFHQARRDRHPIPTVIIPTPAQACRSADQGEHNLFIHKPAEAMGRAGRCRCRCPCRCPCRCRCRCGDLIPRPLLPSIISRERFLNNRPLQQAREVSMPRRCTSYLRLALRNIWGGDLKPPHPSSRRCDLANTKPRQNTFLLFFWVVSFTKVRRLRTWPTRP